MNIIEVALLAEETSIKESKESATLSDTAKIYLQKLERRRADLIESLERADIDYTAALTDIASSEA